MCSVEHRWAFLTEEPISEINKYFKILSMFATVLHFHCFLFFLAGSAYRECMDNGTWALKSNYSNCEPILEEKVSVASQEQPCYVLHSVSNLQTILDKCSSQLFIITLMAHREYQSDLARLMWCFDCLTLIELHFICLCSAVKLFVSRRLNKYMSTVLFVSL